MKFLLDVQLPKSALGPFRSSGHDAWHVADLMSARSKDIDIWRLAAGLGAVIVTKDEDFVRLQTNLGDAVAIVWLRCGNIYNPALIALIDDRLSAIIQSIERGTRLIELH